MWKIISRPRKVWNKIPEKEKMHHRRATPIAIRKPPVRHIRPVRPGEPLAYCAGCKDWIPMLWLPIAERGKRAEKWFECEFCGGRDLTLQYLPENRKQFPVRRKTTT